MRRDHALGWGLLALLAGCDGNGYQMVDGKMAYQTWDAGNGTQTTYLRDVDAGSFKSLSNADYGKDNKQVYYRGVIVWGADPATFDLLEFPYARDAKQVYSLTVPVNGADVATFEVLHPGVGKMHRRDASEHQEEFEDLYGTIPTVPEDEEIYVGDGWARDKQTCYYGPTSLEATDPASFEVLNAFYAKDEQNVYFRRRIIPGADPKSFRLIDDFLARDDLHRYHFGERKPLNYLAPK